MVIKYAICDRCGKRIENPDGVGNNICIDFGGPTLFVASMKDIKSRHMDLCWDCAKSFGEWIVASDNTRA